MVTCIRDLGDCSTIATGSFDTKIILWDIANSYQCVQIIEHNNGPITCLDFSYDDKLLIAGSHSGFILLFKIHYDKLTKIYSGCELINKFNSFGQVLDISRCFRKPQLMVTLESDFILRLYNIEKKEIVAQIPNDTQIVDFLVIESEKDFEPLIFAIDNKGNLLKFDLENS